MVCDYCGKSGRHTHIKVESFHAGLWAVEDTFDNMRDARRYIKNAAFWDAIPRRVKTTSPVKGGR